VFTSLGIAALEREVGEVKADDGEVAIEYQIVGEARAGQGEWRDDDGHDLTKVA